MKVSVRGIAFVFGAFITGFIAFYYYIAIGIVAIMAARALRREGGRGYAAVGGRIVHDANGAAFGVRPQGYAPWAMRIFTATTRFAAGAWFEVMCLFMEVLFNMNIVWYCVASRRRAPAALAGETLRNPSPTRPPLGDTFLAVSRRKPHLSSECLDEQEDHNASQRDAPPESVPSAAPRTPFHLGAASPNGQMGPSSAARAFLGPRGSVELAEVFAPAPPGSVNILIMNHRCRIDWMVLWLLLVRAGHTSAALEALKIVLKAPLSRVPIFGWGTQCFRFLFLSRKWADDERDIMRAMVHATSGAESSLLLIFPEGTDLSPSNAKKNAEYARANNLPVTMHTLLPRTTGLVAIKNLIGPKRVNAIIDVTVAYADAVRGHRTDEKALIEATMPTELAFVCERFVLEGNAADGASVAWGTAPSADDAFKRWIDARFLQKELDLSLYYNKGSYGFSRGDLEGQAVRDGEGNLWDRFVVGDNSAESLFAQSRFAQAPPRPWHRRCFGEGGVGLWKYAVKPLLWFVPPALLTFVYCPLLAASWVPMFLLAVWIVGISAVFIRLKSSGMGTFDTTYTYPELVPQSTGQKEKSV